MNQLSSRSQDLPISQAPAPGFADPVRDSQQGFRALLDALAHPGCIVTLAAACGRPEALDAAPAAALLTLADYDTPVWLGPGLDDAAIATWLRFHTGAPLVADSACAAIVLLKADALPDLQAFSLGSDIAPEQGATLLIQTPDLTDETAIVARGPGILGEIGLPSCGLTDAFWQQRAALNDAFPRGLDIYFCAGDAMLGLPRSSHIGMRA
ncbi:phosphonate C-P lyase system protein PhnH [Ferrovibrio sp.]|uniref:phosphonate C-P lyase system protein PhnH n=1 Tax=Ferrovibrio sp. TaxID=1917215 RepID=UPI0035B3B895